ncbi:hypothetical protein MtrunA17_Chr1g0161481 [Medicago truncatula]|uniref:Uncharacterized protein n=1 Tax=Medicago truncatula TaxID=3880 RepID=A0A396JIK5_MEDTR|nr:hypothetical protein MtrunA17_Chr1g0161481 [Medicago truncatula]
MNELFFSSMFLVLIVNIMKTCSGIIHGYFLSTYLLLVGECTVISKHARLWRALWTSIMSTKWK